MIKRVTTVVALLGALFTANYAKAQTTPIPELGFKLGDDVATVKAALKTDAEIEPMEIGPGLISHATDMNKGKSVLHLRTKGIWVFFSATGTAETIRLDAPYTGQILGMKLGDDVKKLIATRGNPIFKPTPAFMTMQAYRYALDDSAYVSFDVDDDGIQYIFITK